MKNGTTPILAGIQQQIYNWRLVIYLQKRDDYRANLAIPRSQRWTETTTALATQVYGVYMSSLPQASHKVKLTWDKHWYKDNQADTASNVEDYNELSACPLCYNTESGSTNRQPSLRLGHNTWLWWKVT